MNKLAHFTLIGSAFSLAIAAAAVASATVASMTPALGSLLSIVLGAWVGRASSSWGRAVGEAVLVTAVAVAIGTSLRGFIGVLPWSGVAMATAMGAATAAIAGPIAFKVASRGRTTPPADQHLSKN